MGITIRGLRDGPPYPIGTVVTFSCDVCGFATEDDSDYITARGRRTAIGWLERQDEIKGRQFLCPMCK